VEAHRLGLVTAVADDLPHAAEAWTRRLATKSGTALAAAREALREGSHGGLDDALARTEQVYRTRVAGSADAEEGVRAFQAKRAPRWTHGR
jgi:enoyl-CoA hydratase/carnithine racemase